MGHRRFWAILGLPSRLLVLVRSLILGLTGPQWAFMGLTGATTFLEDSGYIAWVTAACGPYWGSLVGRLLVLVHILILGLTGLYWFSLGFTGHCCFRALLGL